jgi:hypothetical protein
VRATHALLELTNSPLAITFSLLPEKGNSACAFFTEAKYERPAKLSHRSKVPSSVQRKRVCVGLFQNWFSLPLKAADVCIFRAKICPIMPIIVVCYLLIISFEININNLL